MGLLFPWRIYFKACPFSENPTTDRLVYIKWAIALSVS